jgi:hypothetical protein
MDFNVNISAILSATAAMFAIGGVWYGAIFSRNWQRIHGMKDMSKMTDAEKKKLMRESHMGALYGAQFVITLFNAFALAILISSVKNAGWATIAVLTWFGFLLPAEVSAVLFGAKMKPKFMVEKIVISISGGLICNLVGALIISLMK